MWVSREGEGLSKQGGSGAAHWQWITPNHTDPQAPAQAHPKALSRLLHLVNQVNLHQHMSVNMRGRRVFVHCHILGVLLACQVTMSTLLLALLCATADSERLAAFSNRAAAHLVLGRYSAAETDCR
jgi:hypothetical protein